MKIVLLCHSSDSTVHSMRDIKLLLNIYTSLIIYVRHNFPVGTNVQCDSLKTKSSLVGLMNLSEAEFEPV